MQWLYKQWLNNYSTLITNRRGMRQQNINVRRNPIPFIQAGLASREIECPVVERWLPRSSVDSDPVNHHFRIFQIEAVGHQLSNVGNIGFF